MSKAKVVLNRKNVMNSIRKSSEMRELLNSITSDIRDKCGDGYATDIKYMPTVVIASVYTATPEAYRDNLQNNTLLKASRA